MHGSYTSFILSPSKPLLVIRHFSFVCLVLVFFYVTISIVTIKVKPLNYMRLFPCFGQVQLCSPGVSPYVKVLSLLLQVEKQKFRRELIFFITSVETMYSQKQILKSCHPCTHPFIHLFTHHPSFHLPTHPPTYLFIHPAICLSL